MNASMTARELARTTVTKAIKDAARHQVAAEGAARLSVRAVAREIGMVSSAVYRYFPTRDDLLTALIVDAYQAVGGAVESALADGVPGSAEATEPIEPVSPASEYRSRWRSICSAVRGWAREHPQEYGLIYGSPVPGYRAPQDTIAPAARVPIAVIACVHAGWSAGAIEAGEPVPMAETLGQQVGSVIDELSPDLPPALLLRAAIAWTQLFGMVSFELFGQLVGTFDPADEFFETSSELMADFLGIVRDCSDSVDGGVGTTA